MTTVQEVNRRYSRERQRALRAGTWQRMYSVEEISAHVRSLNAAGMSARAIASAAGVSHPTVSALIWPAHCDARTKGVTVPVARALLAVHGPAQAPADAMVPLVGTRRRVRALQRMGWSLRLIAEDAGLAHQSVSFAAGQWRVVKAHADAIARTYDRLSMRPGPSNRSRIAAAKAGWPPPLAWDDDTIDDPTAQPANVDRSGRVLLDLDEWLFLVDGGIAPAEAAARCGVTVSAVERAAYRNNRDDVLDAVAGIRSAMRRSA